MSYLPEVSKTSTSDPSDQKRRQHLHGVSFLLTHVPVATRWMTARFETAPGFLGSPKLQKSPRLRRLADLKPVTEKSTG